MTRFCIIADEDREVKMVTLDWRISPLIAVNNPLLTESMPKGLTAATGMDALTHAIEAYVSTISNPVTDACALHAIKLISTYLPLAVEDGNNQQARDMMSYAEFLAGMAFNSASLGYVHTMAHQLGGFCNHPHGECNTILLPVVEEFNAKANPELFIDIAEAMGLETKADQDATVAAAAVLQALRDLKSRVGIKSNLKELGVDPKDFGVLADNAMKDACGLTNPVTPTREDVIAMFQRAYDQDATPHVADATVTLSRQVPQGAFGTLPLSTQQFINNEFVDSVNPQDAFKTVNPATEEVLATVQKAGKADVDKAVWLPSTWRAPSATSALPPCCTPTCP